MIIDNPESLKEWLTACLEPKCDADPAALAKYVMALVKKDRPEKELKDICLDQLDVFLQKETKPFVDLLFETLNSKSYIRPNSTSIASVTANATNVITSSESTTNNNTAVVNSTTSVNGNPSCLGSSSVRNSSGGRTPQSSNTSIPSGTSFKSDSKKKEGFSSETEGRERRHRSRSRSRSGSRSPAGRTVNRTRSHSRETDERRGRRFSDDDRRRRIPPSRRFENRYRDFRERRVQETSNRDRSRERDRERERERDVRSARERSGRDRTVPNERDRSRSRSRSGSWNRNRSRSRSGTWSRSPSRSRSRSRSRSWSRSRERSRERNRTEGHDSRNLGDASQLTVDHGDTDYRLATGTTATSASLVTTTTTTSAAATESVSALTPTVTPTQSTSVENNQFSAKTAKRCRDYDEMGYCMRGDLCPYDHGNDPVVVEDVSVLGFAPNAAAAPPVTQVSASSISSNTMHHIIPPIMGQSSPRPPLPTHPPPPPPPQPPQPEPYIPEPYNPEAPGLDRPTRVQPPFWTPSGPPPRPPSVRSSGPRGPHPPPPLSSVFHPNHPPRTRELIGVPTVDDARELNAGPAKVSNNGRMVIEPHRPVITMSGSQTNTTPSNTGLISSVGPQHLNHTNHTNDVGMKRRPFDYSRLGPKKQMNISNDRCTLELRKVPRHLNTIAELNSHFSKFGTIVNLQVCYEGDPEAALLQFSSHVEANSAYRSTEAVLNNRFVKMFWHNKDNNSNNQKQRQVPQSEDQNENGDSSVVKPSIKDRLSLQVNVAKTNTASNTNLVTSSSSVEETTERTVIYSPIGNLSRTVFNPAVLKKTNVPSSILPRKTKEEHKKDNLKKKMEVQKKRQQLVQTHVQHQKILVEKLEKCKNEKEKSDIKETLNTLAKKIADLQSDIRKEAGEISQLSSAANHRTPRTKAEAEKELLDAEMDLYNKQHRGDDTTELRQKVHELRLQARALGLLDGSGRGRGMKSRRSINSIRGRGRGVVHHKLTSVDHRPRKIVVKGLTEEEKDTILSHFLQFAEVENVEHNASGTVVAFKTRRDAELAISHGSKFNDRMLALTWYKELSTTPGDTVSDLEGLVDDLTADEEHHQPLLEVEEDILLADDEEEEDSEARSWRR